MKLLHQSSNTEPIPGAQKSIRHSDDMATNSIKLLTGNSHPELAKLVADRQVYSASGLSDHLRAQESDGEASRKDV